MVDEYLSDIHVTYGLSPVHRHQEKRCFKSGASLSSVDCWPSCKPCPCPQLWSLQVPQILLETWQMVSESLWQPPSAVCVQLSSGGGGQGWVGERVRRSGIVRYNLWEIHYPFPALSNGLVSGGLLDNLSNLPLLDALKPGKGSPSGLVGLLGKLTSSIPILNSFVEWVTLK